jgi:simple sugar transport system substrate-binding protein/basic membrane protein A
VFTNGRSTDTSAIAPKNVLTNIVEKWGEMYEAIGQQDVAGTGGGKFSLYGLNTKGSTGAQLAYDKDHELNPLVPKAISDEIAADKKKFASGALTVSVTAKDARGGL